MNLWDSIHRGLDKASQEAARMARAQRLRTIIDGLTRHINTQHTLLIGKTMELYTSGQLTQSELLPVCQTIAELQQQMQQAQNELKLLQGNTPLPPPPPQLQGQGTAPQAGATMLYPTPGETIATGTATPPSDFQTDAGPLTAPPPPPTAESFAGMETLMAPPPPPAGMSSLLPTPTPTPTPAGTDAPRYCPVCQSELNPGYAFCHNCGTPVQHSLAQMPTMRASESVLPSSTPPAEENEGV
ncbi:MAG TPA: zinc ribbon domain-containing protein [Ktedonobacteraceae bacterium]|nr:zinc ribbon domain-containing protein [Ktedonobacteraceae bacterium]